MISASIKSWRWRTHAGPSDRATSARACVASRWRLILEGAIKDGDTIRVTFDGNDFLFNGKSDKKAA